MSPDFLLCSRRTRTLTPVAAAGLCRFGVNKCHLGAVAETAGAVDFLRGKSPRNVGGMAQGMALTLLVSWLMHHLIQMEISQQLLH